MFNLNLSDKKISSAEFLKDQYDNFLFDVDGVLFNNSKAIPFVKEFLE